MRMYFDADRGTEFGRWGLPAQMRLINSNQFVPGLKYIDLPNPIVSLLQTDGHARRMQTGAEQTSYNPSVVGRNGGLNYSCTCVHCINQDGIHQSACVPTTEKKYHYLRRGLDDRLLGERLIPRNISIFQLANPSNPITPTCKLWVQNFDPTGTDNVYINRRRDTENFDHPNTPRNFLNHLAEF